MKRPGIEAFQRGWQHHRDVDLLHRAWLAWSWCRMAVYVQKRRNRRSRA